MLKHHKSLYLINLSNNSSGYTQEVLPNKLGITRGAVTHYLSGRRVPPLKQLQKLVATLKTNPAWLQFGKVSTKATVGSSLNKKEEKAARQYPSPVLSWDQISLFSDSSTSKDEIKSFIPNFFSDQKH